MSGVQLVYIMFLWFAVGMVCGKYISEYKNKK